MSPAHPSSAGKRGLFRVSATDPEPKSAQAIREDLGVPSLDGDNTFTGTNSFEGTTAVEGLDANGALNVYGSLDVTTDDPATFDKNPTVGGVALIEDAPSDGKYYVRKDGAWVEIVP